MVQTAKGKKQKSAHWLKVETVTMLEEAADTINSEGLYPVPIRPNVLVDECVKRALPDVVKHYRRLKALTSVRAPKIRKAS